MSAHKLQPGQAPCSSSVGLAALFLPAVTLRWIVVASGLFFGGVFGGLAPRPSLEDVRSQAGREKAQQSSVNRGCHESFEVAGLIKLQRCACKYHNKHGVFCQLYSAAILGIALRESPTHFTMHSAGKQLNTPTQSHS